MAGPTKQFDQDAALAKALEIFWKQGYEATSMQDLVTHMGINRASMYDTFGNKAQLFRKSIAAYCSQTLAEMRDILAAEGPALVNIMRYFQTLGNSMGIRQHRGCFLNNTAVELGPHDPDIAKFVRHHWSQIETQFKNTLDRAVAQGELKPGTDTDALARVFSTLIQGLAVSSKVKVSGEHMASVVTTVFTLIQTANHPE